jgi:type I restriction enzyme S subunit
VPQELEGANLTQGTARIAPGPDTDPGYLLAHINASSTQTYFDLMAKGATFREITLEVLRKTPVLVPPLDEQRQIAAWAKQHSDQFLALIREAEIAQGLLKERRSTLISAAVTGQIDVRVAR